MKHLDPNGNETCDRIYLLHHFINSMEQNQIVQNKHCPITVLGKTLRSNYVEFAKLLLHSIIVQLHQVNCKSFTTYALIIFSGWNMKGMTNNRLRLQKKIGLIAYKESTSRNSILSPTIPRGMGDHVRAKARASHC